MAHLLLAMLVVLSAEVHDLASEDCVDHRISVYELAELYHEVGSEGALVSPDADPYILAAWGFFESRWRVHSKDGDCHPNGRYGDVCSSVGPMQVSKGATRWPYFAHMNLTVKKLRDPETNVRVAYEGLKFWKARCGGAISVTLDSFQRGRCAKRPSWEGRRRCALAAAMGGFDWNCGKPTRHTRYLIRRLDNASSSIATVPR